MSDDYSLYVVGLNDRAASDKTAIEPDAVPHAAAESLKESLLGEKPVPADNLRKSWERTHAVLIAMIDDADRNPDRSFKLEEMDVSLAVSGKGYIGFASAQAAAGITLRFRRR